MDQLNDDKQAILAGLENEADGMTAPPFVETDPPQIEEPIQLHPDEVYDATHEMIVGGIKAVIQDKPNGKLAGEVWETPLFKTAVIPVLKKYNITMLTMPVELVLLGVIFVLAKKTVDITKEAEEDGSKKTATA